MDKNESLVLTNAFIKCAKEKREMKRATLNQASEESSAEKSGSSATSSSIESPLSTLGMLDEFLLTGQFPNKKKAMFKAEPEIREQAVNHQDLLMEALKDYKSFMLSEDAGVSDACFDLVEEHTIDCLVMIYCESPDLAKSTYFREFLVKELKFSMSDALKLFVFFTKKLKGIQCIEKPNTDV